MDPASSSPFPLPISCRLGEGTALGGSAPARSQPLEAADRPGGGRWWWEHCSLRAVTVWACHPHPGPPRDRDDASSSSHSDLASLGHTQSPAVGEFWGPMVSLCCCPCKAPATNKALTISALPVLLLFPPNSMREVGKSCSSCAHPLRAGIRLLPSWATSLVLSRSETAATGIPCSEVYSFLIRGVCIMS